VLSRLEQVGSAAGSRGPEAPAGLRSRGRASWGGGVRVHTTKDSPDRRGEGGRDGGEDSLIGASVGESREGRRRG
jgi:hypothetical protein